MKSAHKIEYNRLVDGLIERGLVAREAMNHVLTQCSQSGALLPEVLVRDDLISDWELTRVASELYGLPCLVVSAYQPEVDAARGIDVEFLKSFCLVPLDRFGEVLTVSMPALVPTQVLEAIERSLAVRVLPLIGSVQANRAWLNDNAEQLAKLAANGAPAPKPAAEPAAAIPAPNEGSDQPTIAVEMEEEGDGPKSIAMDEGDWADVFEAGDQAVQLDLEDRQAG